MTWCFNISLSGSVSWNFPPVQFNEVEHLTQHSLCENHFWHLEERLFHSPPPLPAPSLGRVCLEYLASHESVLESTLDLRSTRIKSNLSLEKTHTCKYNLKMYAYHSFVVFRFSFYHGSLSSS